MGRDAMVAMDVDRRDVRDRVHVVGFDALHAGVTAQSRQALRDVCGGGFVTCRFTHVYPDGPAPYFTCWRRAESGAGSSNGTLKTAAADAVLAARRDDHTTTPSGATTGPGTTGNGPNLRGRVACGQARSTRPASSTPAY